jgi:hypothetical protein
VSGRWTEDRCAVDAWGPRAYTALVVYITAVGLLLALVLL